MAEPSAVRIDCDSCERTVSVLVSGAEFFRLKGIEAAAGAFLVAFRGIEQPLPEYALAVDAAERALDSALRGEEAK